MRTAAKKEIVYSSEFVCSLAASSSQVRLCENSHPGYQASCTTPHEDFGLANSNTVTGFRATLPAARTRPCLSTYTRDSYTGLDYAQNRYYASSYGRFNTADPYQASGGPKDPGSWNRYTYTEGDPINYNDPSGLIRLKKGTPTGGDGGGPAPGPITAPGYSTIWRRPPQRIGNGGGGYSANQDPQGTAYSFAVADQSLVEDGALTDCQGLAAFAGAIAPLFSNTSSFVNAFGVLTPQGAASTVAGVAYNSQPVFLNTGQTSGYQYQYQNTLPDNPSTNGDQGHHFAAFFQYGYSSGGNASMAANVFEIYQGADSGVMNVGDVNLGIAAAQIGADLASGKLTTAGVAGAISKLCN